jgi:hypothetical protein
MGGVKASIDFESIVLHPSPKVLSPLGIFFWPMMAIR